MTISQDNAVVCLTIWTTLSGLFWLARAVALELARRRQPRLDPDQPAPLPEPAPSVSVVIAGKDEQAGIEAAVRSLLDQDYPGLEIILVNDRSGDATPQIIDRLAGEFPDRVRALHVRELPDGWAGKNNAMRTGIATARGQWLLMVDADCRQQSPRAVRVAVSRAMATGADMLSVMAAMEPRHFWDRAVQPLLAGLLLAWFHPSRVNDPSSPVAYANGAFVLMRRSVYDALGGHAAVAGEVNEDIHMARLAKAQGYRLHLALNGGLYLTRMYDGLDSLIRGWSRIFYGSFKSVRPLLIALAVMATLSVVPTVMAAMVAAAWLTGQGGDGLTGLTVATAAALICQMIALGRFFELAGVRAWYAACYPLAAMVQAWVLVRAIWHVVSRGRQVVWRGTTVRPAP